MATLRFLWKRFVAQRLLGLAVVVTLAFSVGVLVAGPIYADAAREAILSSELAGAPPTVRNARLQVFGDQSFDWDGGGRGHHRARPSRFPWTGWSPGPRHGPPRVAGRAVRAHPRARGYRGSSRDPRATRPAKTGSSSTPRWPGSCVCARATVWTSSVLPGSGWRSSSPAPTSRPERDDPFWFGSQNPFPDPDSTQPQPADRRPRHAGPRHAGSGAHDPVRVGRVPRAHGRAVRAGLGRSGPAGADLHEPADGGGAEHGRPDLGTGHAPRHRPPADRRPRRADPPRGLPDRRRRRWPCSPASVRSHSPGRRSSSRCCTAEGSAGVCSSPRRRSRPGSPRSSRTRSGCCSAWASRLSPSTANGPDLPGVVFPIRLNSTGQLLGLVAAARRSA